MKNLVQYLVGSVVGVSAVGAGVFAVIGIWLFAVVVQTVIAAIGFVLIFEYILPMAEGFYAAEGTIRDYLVFGLVTVPLRIILFR